MSEAKSSKGSKTKTETAVAKSESAAAPKAKDSADSKPAATADAKTTEGDGKTTDGGAKTADGGKSARESIGGKSDVHYGYFSSVRTPAYRSGWDTIWGGKEGGDDADGEETQRRAASAAKTRKRRAPITVTLDLDDLPSALRDGLVEIARAELKKSRVSYARRDKAGAVDWRITCRVD